MRQPVTKSLVTAALALGVTVAAPMAHIATAQAQGAKATSQSATVAPKLTTQAPGFFRMAIGDMVVTALYDGYIDLPDELFQGVPPEDFTRLLARMFVDSAEGAQTAVNAYLVHTGDRLILIDTGAAKVFGPTLGNIVANLGAAGYTPSQVDAVLLTHLHPDHASGLMSPKGAVVFPKATVHVAKSEADFWLSDAVAATKPEPMRPMFQLAQKAVAKYKKAGRFKTFVGDAAIVPGVRPVAASGHTPGHTGFMVSSKGADLLVWGDIVHSHAAQFVNPKIALEFDVDQAAAIATRERLFERAAAERLWVAGAHLPFPGIGHVRADGAGAFAWVPVEWGPIRTDD